MEKMYYKKYFFNYKKVFGQRNLLYAGLRKRLLNMKIYFTNSLKLRLGGVYIDIRYLYGGA